MTDKRRVEKRNMSNRAPSGFLKPTAISNELADFVGKPYGSEMARREVTLFLNQYIREHNLQNPQNGRIILADEKLRKLLKLEPTTELTYFNLQSHIAKHFTKQNPIPKRKIVRKIKHVNPNYLYYKNSYITKKCPCGEGYIEEERKTHFMFSKEHQKYEKFVLECIKDEEILFTVK